MPMLMMICSNFSDSNTGVLQAPSRCPRITSGSSGVGGGMELDAPPSSRQRCIQRHRRRWVCSSSQRRYCLRTPSWNQGARRRCLGSVRQNLGARQRCLGSGRRNLGARRCCLDSGRRNLGARRCCLGSGGRRQVASTTPSRRLLLGAGFTGGATLGAEGEETLISKGWVNTR
jgi:hypothetical protein